MRFESLGVLWGTLAAVVGIAALHLLSWRRPQPRWLPTARFVPAQAQRAVSRRLEPSDLTVLAARVLALLALGAAAAGPIVQFRRAGVARVIMADRSRSVADIAQVRDSVRRWGEGAANVQLIAFDSVPAGVDGASLADASATDRRGDIDAALIAGIRAGVALRAAYDSVELVVVSPVQAEEVRGAAESIVQSWGGPVRFVRVAARDPVTPPSLTSGAWPEATDAVGAALRLSLGAPPAWLRVVRGAPNAVDSLHAEQGGALVVWPIVPGDGAENAGIRTRRGVAVGRFTRATRAQGAPIAWWNDGQPAAVEVAHGRGCIRSVGIGLPVAGDAPLRPAFLRLVGDVSVPCGWRDTRIVSDSALSWLTGPSTAARAPVPTVGRASPLARRILLALALVALGGEWWLRRRREGRVALPLARESVA